MANLRRHNQQTIAWFNDLNKRGLLDLDPPYQRRSVWNQAYKDAFIDTILIQYPRRRFSFTRRYHLRARQNCTWLMESNG